MGGYEGIAETIREKHTNKPLNELTVEEIRTVHQVNCWTGEEWNLLQLTPVHQFPVALLHLCIPLGCLSEPFLLHKSIASFDLWLGLDLDYSCSSIAMQ